MRRLKQIVWALLFIGLLAYLSTGIKQIRPGERAIVRRFGQVLDVQPKPGVWIGLPAGMDRVDKIAVDQVRRVTVGFREGQDVSSDITPAGQMITGDQNLVNVQIVVSYVVDTDDLVTYVLHQARCEQMLALTCETVLAEWVGGQEVMYLLSQGKSELPGEVLARARERLKHHPLGVKLRSVSLTFLLPPDDVRDAFDRVNQAAARMDQQTNEAKQFAEQERSKADAESIGGAKRRPPIARK